MRRLSHKKIIIIIVAIIVIALTVIWCIWRQKVTASSGENPTPTPVVSATTSTTTPTPTPTADPATIEHKKQAALAYEHAARDWGTNPSTAMNTNNALKNTWDVLNSLRTPTTMDRKPLEQLGTIQFHNDWGPNAPSTLCAEGSAAQCHNYPTQLAYWRSNNWLMGARINTAQATVNNDGTITVDGLVNVVLWSWPYNAVQVHGATYQDQYWGFSPRSGTIPFTSTLTVQDDGTITQRVSDTTQWIADPWFLPWTTTPAEDTGSWQDSTQINIPLRGARPDGWSMEGMNPDITIRILANSDDMSSDVWRNLARGNVGEPA